MKAHSLPDAFGAATAAFTDALKGWSEPVDGVTAEDVTDEIRAAGGLYDNGMTGDEIVEQFERWLAS